MLDFIKERAQEALPQATKMHWVFENNLGDRLRARASRVPFVRNRSLM
jgi:hypothetical protein